MTMRIFFDTQQLYYLPQYIPVYEELCRRGCKCSFLLYQQDQIAEQLRSLIKKSSLPLILIDPVDAENIYRHEAPDWVIFGNHQSFSKPLPSCTRTALIYHGIGIKECYYDSRLANMDVRFVEGPFRLTELKRRFPSGCFVDTGFPKLDPLFNQANIQIQPQKRPTILYAPTFYPSSIEMMPTDWPSHFKDCEIVIKPHFFSVAMAGYEKQRRRLDRWAEQFSHVRIAGFDNFSLVPYMERADLLISEASSALFEFAALDRPVVWLDFFKLRWSYRGPLRFRFERRMDKTILQYADIAAHVSKPADLARVICEELSNPQRLSSVRQRYTAELIGPTDGRASERIANYLISGF